MNNSKYNTSMVYSGINNPGGSYSGGATKRSYDSGGGSSRSYDSGGGSNHSCHTFVKKDEKGRQVYQTTFYSEPSAHDIRKLPSMEGYLRFHNISNARSVLSPQMYADAKNKYYTFTAPGIQAELNAAMPNADNDLGYHSGS